MKIKSLMIQNFLTIGEGEVKLDDRGLCLIQGINNDDSSAISNGSGKSSIADALAWCIYGITARGYGGDSVVNKVTGKDTVVGAHIEDGPYTYQICRYRKHKINKNRTLVSRWDTDNESTTVVDLTKGTEKDTQEVIDQIMGCSLEVFMAAIYAGQEAMSDLPRMTDKQLKVLIEEAAGVQRLEQAYLLARGKKNDKEAALRGVNDYLGKLKDEVVRMEAEIVDAAKNEAAFEASREKKRDIALAKSESVMVEMRAIAAIIKGYNEKSLLEHGATIDAQLSSHSKLVTQQKGLFEAGHDLASKAVTQTAHYDSLLSAIKRLKAQLDNAETEVSKPCEACGKPGDKHDLESFKKHLEEKIKGYFERAKETKVLKEELDAKVAEAKRAYDEFSATIPDVSTLSAKRSEITKALKEIETAKNSLLLKKKDYEAHLQEADRAMKEPNPYSSLVKSLKENKEKTEGFIEKQKSLIENMEKEVSVLDSVVKVFGPAGVRAHILDTVTPFLNDRTSYYLSILSDGNISAVWATLTENAKGELKEKFNIEVTNDKGAESYAGLSGGEKRKVRLATMLALQDLVASRATKSIDLYLCDEIDDAIDPAGLERLMTILDVKAKERGTVLVISHNDLKSWIDSVCTVTKTGGLSTIEGALS